MAANWGRIKYDECAYNQDMKMTTEPGMYNFYNDRFENDIITDRTGQKCDSKMQKKLGSNLCENNAEATINYTNEAFNNKVIDIESNLKLYLNESSKCTNKKYYPKKLDCANDSKECDKEHILVTPNLSDRLIVPTNMKMPTSSGLN